MFVVHMNSTSMNGRKMIKANLTIDSVYCKLVVSLHVPLQSEQM